jgi:DNA-directed RNA polymerase specialized sigma24 family protein
MSCMPQNFATPEQVMEALCKLTPYDFEQMSKAARIFRCFNTFYAEPEDLIHESIHRCLDGRRNWNQNLSFVAFLTRTIKSIVNEEYQSLKNKNIVSDRFISDLDESDSPTDIGPCAASPEEEYLNLERRKMIAEKSDILRSYFKNDPDATLVIESWSQDIPPQEMCKNHHISPRAYDLARRRIIRKARITKPHRI